MEAKEGSGLGTGLGLAESPNEQPEVHVGGCLLCSRVGLKGREANGLQSLRACAAPALGGDLCCQRICLRLTLTRR